MNRVEQIERQLAKVFENLPKEYQYTEVVVMVSGMHMKMIHYKELTKTKTY